MPGDGVPLVLAAGVVGQWHRAAAPRAPALVLALGADGEGDAKVWAAAARKTRDYHLLVWQRSHAWSQDELAAIGAQLRAGGADPTAWALVAARGHADQVAAFAAAGAWADIVVIDPARGGADGGAEAAGAALRQRPWALVVGRNDARVERWRAAAAEAPLAEVLEVAGEAAMPALVAGARARAAILGRLFARTPAVDRDEPPRSPQTDADGAAPAMR